MSNKKIIIDSNVIVAAYNTNDMLHQKALKVLKKINKQPKCINYLILNEITTILLLRTKDLPFASKISDLFLNNKVLDFKVSGVSKKLFLKTHEVFSQQKSGKLSFTDCSIIAQAEQDGAVGIVTFDKDLKKEFSDRFTFI